MLKGNDVYGSLRTSDLLSLDDVIGRVKQVGVSVDGAVFFDQTTSSQFQKHYWQQAPPLQAKMHSLLVEFVF